MKWMGEPENERGERECANVPGAAENSGHCAMI